MVLRISNLHIPQPGANARFLVENVSLDVGHSEVVCIVGESGSGKSLTAKAVMGLLGDVGLNVTKGEILFQGNDLLDLSDRAMRDLRGKRIAMIFQEPMSALNPLMRVADQVAEVFDIHALPLSRADKRARVLALLEAMRLPDPERIASSFPFELSGGQRQRVMIAMAFALDPALLIADEPTTALDVTTQMQILRVLKEMQAEHGTSVLFITHDFGVVAEIADRVVVMRDGRVVEAGTKEDILLRPRHDYTRALLASVPKLHWARHAKPTPKPVLEVEALSKTYRSRRNGFFGPATSVAALDEVSLRLGRKETVAVVGESGSGKTTLSRCLVGLVTPTSGRISLHGEDLGSLSRTRRGKAIQMVFQDPFASLNPRMRVRDIVMAGPLAHGVPAAQAEQKALELLSLVGLPPDSAGRYPHQFSGGQRQRIGLARALALEPEILVADEPVSALDVTVQAQVLALLKDLKDQLGLSMVFVTHDLRVACELADRIVVMQSGRVVEEGTPAAIFGAPARPYTRQLIASIPGAEEFLDSDGEADEAVQVAKGSSIRR